MNVAGLLAQGRSESSAFHTVRARLDCSCHPLRSAGQCSPLCFGLPSTPSKFSAFNSDGHGPEPALGLRVNGLIIRLFDTVAVPSRPDWKRKTLVDPESPAGRARAQVRGGLRRPRLGGPPGVPRTRTPAVERADRYALPSGGPQSSRNRQGWEWGVGEGSPSRAGRAPPGSAARFPEPGRSGSGAGDAARPELGLASTYCSGACPAWRALLSPPRARPPPPPALKGREPGAGSAGRQRGWAARAPGDTRFRSLLPRAGAPGAPQGAGRRYAGRAPEEDAGEEGFRPLSGGSPSIRAARSVSRTPRAAWARSASGARCGAAGRCAESARGALAAGERSPPSWRWRRACAGSTFLSVSWFSPPPPRARALYACVCVVLVFCFS